MKEWRVKLPPHEHRALGDRLVTEMDLNGGWGVAPADGCLGRSSAGLWVMAASAITRQQTEPHRRRTLQMFACTQSPSNNSGQTSGARIKFVAAALNIHYGRLSGQILTCAVRIQQTRTPIQKVIFNVVFTFIPCGSAANSYFKPPNRNTVWILGVFLGMLNVTQLSSFSAVAAIGDGYRLSDLKWLRSRLNSESKTQLWGTTPLSHFLTHFPQACNSSRPVPIQLTGSEAVSGVSGESYFMTGVSGVSTQRFCLITTQSPGKEKAKYTPLLLFSKTKRRGWQTRLLNIHQGSVAPPNKETVPGSLSQRSQFSKFSSVLVTEHFKRICRYFEKQC